LDAVGSSSLANPFDFLQDSVVLAGFLNALPAVGVGFSSVRFENSTFVALEAEPPMAIDVSPASVDIFVRLVLAESDSLFFRFSAFGAALSV
jgi:hypothetical protein